MQQRDNSGVLFKNTSKQGETQPDYKGETTINGAQYWVSAWINESENGSKYMALKYRLKIDTNQISGGNQ